MATQPQNSCLYVCRILKTLLSGKLLVILIEISMLNLLLPLCFSLTCPSSSSKSNVMSTEKFNFTNPLINPVVKRIASGPVSNSLYYMYSSSNTQPFTALRKVNKDNYAEWMISLSEKWIGRSLSVDSKEKSIYLALSDKNAVWRFSPITGAIIDSQVL